MTSPSPQFYHVSPSGNDRASGSEHDPLQTVSAAAAKAVPGDTIRIHTGIYRERVDPPRGGSSPDCRITYESAGDGPAELTGADILDGWQAEGPLWSAEVDNALFDGDNPYAVPLNGHWFNALGRNHHRGAVYCNGQALREADNLEELRDSTDPEGRWWAAVEGDRTRFFIYLPDADPTDSRMEIAVRACVFYPSRPGISFLTLRGLRFTRAATPWSPPTTEQVGIVGTHWGRGWMVEDNEIAYAVCAGLTLGKYSDPEDYGDRPIVEGTAGADTYHHTIARALENGWGVEKTGGHVVRRNHIHHCEQAGICGSLGAVRCRIEENIIHDIHRQRRFGGFEQAGIKFHGAVDTLIAHNRIFRCYRGIWLDWMSQGTRVTANLLYNNDGAEDLFTEVNHGPFVVDHNLFLSGRSLVNWSHGGAYVHNLFAGEISVKAETGRQTPWLEAHGTQTVGNREIQVGDDRFLNNVFLKPEGMIPYTNARYPVRLEGNVYTTRCPVSDLEPDAGILDSLHSFVQVEERSDGSVWLRANLSMEPGQGRGQPVTAERLGRARIPDLPFEDENGEPLHFDSDYFGQPHSAPVPGPASGLGGGYGCRKVWWPAERRSRG